MTQLLAAGFVATWLGAAAWAYSDARRRTRGRRLPHCALLAGAVIPYFGVLLYLCVRPPETLEARRERDAFRRLLDGTDDHCLVCRTPIGPRFLCCPICGTDIRRRCPGCQEPLELVWAACPYCQAEVAPPLSRVA